VTDKRLRERVKGKIREGFLLPELSSKAYTENLENAYMTIWDNHQKGFMPAFLTFQTI